MSSIQKLNRLVESLSIDGHPTRLFAAKAAYNFKHSWLEMAQALVEVRNCGEWENWGFDSFLSYCEKELGLKRAVVDKLTTSYYTLQNHAPERLQQMSENAPIPNYQSLDYYSRALGEPRLDGNPSHDAPQQDLSPELRGQLRAAVFDEGCTHKQLRERFDPVIRPKPLAAEQLEATKKAAGTARRLLDQLSIVEGISTQALRGTCDAVAALQDELDARIRSLMEIL
ncbi:MAG: hypothetical protein QNJ97_04045 [Myxococcota bacterium]|nr:hypothetical protein [Myxococcota bacterium]